MKKIIGLIALAAVLMTTFLPLFSVSAAEPDGDYYIYTAEDLATIIETSSNMKSEYVAKDGSSFMSFKLKSASASEYLRANFYPANADESAFTPEFNAKDYPIVVVSCKTNVVNSSSKLAANVGLKLTSTEKYERCWGLTSTTSFCTANTKDTLTKVIFDVSKFNGYESGSANWAGVDANSGLKYFRIPAWNGSTNISNFTNEYFDIEYIGVFKNVNDANAFSFEDYREAKKNTVELYDENGELLETHYVKSGDTLRLPTRKTSSSKVFVGWKKETGSELFNTSVTVFESMKLTATYADCKIYTGDDVSAWTTVNNFTLQNTCFDEDGNIFVRVSTPTPVQSYGNNDFALITPTETIKASEYPVVVIGYRSTITDYGDWALSVSLKVESTGEYKRFWGLSDAHINGGEDQKAVFDVRKVTGGDAGVNYSGVASDSNIGYLRITPYASNWGVEKTPGQYFDITYVAFFEDEASAREFEYSPEKYRGGEENHTAFMLRDTDFAFRPDDNLTRAEAASALARLIVDVNSIAGKYTSFFDDVSASDWYYDEVAYLERLGYVESGSSFNPDDDITKGELAGWLKAANDAGEALSEYPESYTSSSTLKRSEAAKVLSQAAGRTPTADGIRYASTAYFCDVDKTTSNYAYIVEAVYTHSLEYDSNNNELWVNCDDNDFYISKASDTLVAELDAEFDRRVAEIRATASEHPTTSGNSWWGNRTYYVSSKNGNDSNNGTSSSTPFKTLDKIASTNLKSGDVVLLERGSEFRLSGTFSLKSGVTYSAYGTGDKPRVLAGVDASSPSQWSAVSGCPGLYVFNQAFDSGQDIGNIVFNDGEMYGQRVIKQFTSDKLFEAGRDKIVGNGRDFWELDIEKYEFKDYTDILDIVNDQKAAGKNPDLIYFHYWKEYTGGNNKVYLYSAKGNPGDLFESIDLCKRGNVIWVEYSYKDITLDNWALFYGGSHGVGASSCSNLTVRNCEIGWIGGSIQYITPSTNVLVRFGNGIEIYGEADGFYAYNNYVYQCFDCGPTVQWQGKLTDDDDGIVLQKDVEFYDNVLFDSALEVWLSTTSEITDTSYAKLINCKMYNNLVKGGGYGFAGYNHQKNEPCQFYGGGTTKAPYVNCVMENNKFWGSKVNVLKANPTSMVDGQGFAWKNNLIVHPYDGKLGSLGSDPKTATGKIVWYTYNNEVMKMLIANEAFGYNDFVYTLSEGQEDPIEAHNAALAEKISYVEIRTAEELLSISPNGKYKLVADIDLDGISWSPVGTEEFPFTGEFDGNGFEISNLKATTGTSVSLFGICEGAKIVDVTVVDASITVTGGNNDVYAAVIAHKVTDKTEISDCTVSGSVTVDTDGTAYAAGICAYNASSDISDSVSDVIVTVTAGDSAYVAGICAYLYSDATLTGCDNKAEVTADSESTHIGGIYAEMKTDTANSNLVPVVEDCRDLSVAEKGDVNRDGGVTHLDVVILARGVAKWTGYENSINVNSCDLDGDGKVGLIDIVYLSRHLAGWKGYETLTALAYLG